MGVLGKVYILPGEDTGAIHAYSLCKRKNDPEASGSRVVQTGPEILPHTLCRSASCADAFPQRYLVLRQAEPFQGRSF